MEEASWDGVRPITPQVWRHVAEAHQEHLITGSSSWPSGDDGETKVDAKQWWADSSAEEGCASEGIRTEIGGVPCGIDYGLLGGDRRNRIRHMVACAVCARRDWSTTREYVYFWQQSAQNGCQSFISDVSGCSDASKAGNCPDNAPTPREILAH